MLLMKVLMSQCHAASASRNMHSQKKKKGENIKGKKNFEEHFSVEKKKAPRACQKLSEVFHLLFF